MRKIIILLVILFTVVSFAQERATTKYYSKSDTTGKFWKSVAGLIGVTNMAKFAPNYYDMLIYIHDTDLCEVSFDTATGNTKTCYIPSQKWFPLINLESDGNPLPYIRSKYTVVTRVKYTLIITGY